MTLSRIEKEALSWSVFRYHRLHTTVWKQFMALLISQVFTATTKERTFIEKCAIFKLGKFGTHFISRSSSCWPFNLSKKMSETYTIFVLQTNQNIHIFSSLGCFFTDPLFFLQSAEAIVYIYTPSPPLIMIIIVMCLISK